MEKSNSISNSNSNHSNHHYPNFHKQKSHRSMSEDSFHSPLRSPFPFDEPGNNHRPTTTTTTTKSLSSKGSIVSVDYSPRRDPHTPKPENTNKDQLYFNRVAVREDVVATTKVRTPVRGGADVESGEESSPVRTGRTKRELMLTKAGLGFRVCEFALCLISFSVMAADKTQGWSGDSFDRYTEYRYCVAVNIIGFVYSGFQAFDLIYNLASRKHFLSHHTRYHFDFLMDQILAYLIMSASSSAATRAYDWISNWGKDEFTEMASASIGVSFLAFIAFAFSSHISGYNLCNRNAVVTQQ
ncbi:CASP-like protein 4A3 [Lycium ferocissimum]|uniref:CASP-like protein 4A3 n=1 Tax=Lycium ferocissimum TaxID=112874 RepID=UPI00281678AB|nr:CASP-like protein 4A3 [Lycium ferocissimum]